MRNLNVFRRTSRSLENLKETLLCNLHNSKIFSTVDPNNNNLYILSKDQIFIISFDDQCDIISGDLFFDSNVQPIGLEYNSITQQIYCIYKNGNIVAINVESDLEEEVVMQIDKGLLCAKLSPDHEIFSLITNSHTVITMVSTFEILSEIDLYSKDFGQKQFITVGWGKKETQFHGSKGKAAAVAKSADITSNPLDDKLPRITWKGDGSLFAVSFVHIENQLRQFKVFNREGILQYTSELIAGLEESLSWKPSGGLIATTQQLVNKHVVAFFEKNGLKHREFLLPFKPMEIMVKEIFWSPDSEILTIWCEQSQEKKPILLLWTENNYHWYLKQMITLSSIIFVTWSSSTKFGKTLVIVTVDELLTFSFRWTIDHSRGKCSNDKAVVGVIDGNQALLTSFKTGIVPPPMANLTLQLVKPINAIVFAPPIRNEESWIDSNAFFCVLEDNTLAFFKHLTESNILNYEHLNTYKIEWDVPRIAFKHAVYAMHHFVWFKENIIFCSVSENNCSFFCVMTLDGINSQEENRISVRQTYIMDALIEHIVPSPDQEEVYIITQDSVLKYRDEIGFAEIEMTWPAPCHRMEVISIDRTNVIISLTHNNRLYIDEKEIANNISSFYVHPEFLLLTTLHHTLICTKLNRKGMEQLIKQDLTVKPWENEVNEQSYKDNLYIRRVERGSRLIIAIADDSKTILQMPRGNLECIQPRPLSLHIIGIYLSKCDYLAAFMLMRKQRINLNLIYDYKPHLFIDNANKFVEDINNSDWLSLFLSELQDEDVTTTTYVDCFLNHNTESVTTIQVTNKVAHICNLLREIMEQRKDAKRFIQPILISLVKNQETSALEAALRKVKQMKALEKEKNLQNAWAEKALQYLVYLVDINVLYDIALGMYDFELAMFIGSKSQKDPKEYLVFLNNLRKLDENYMKYSIDMHLKRYESALYHISKETDKFNECLNLIREHNFYVQAMKLFDKSSEEYKEIARNYAQHLLNGRKYKEAGIMFLKGNDYNSALLAYKLGVYYEEAIIVSKQINMSTTELHALYEELTVLLKKNRKYKEGAEILIRYLSDYERAVNFLCEGRLWKDAIRIAYDSQHLDFIETYIKPGIYEHAEYILLQINKNKENFEKYKSRLAFIRIELNKKSKQVNNIIMHGDELMSGNEMMDFLSDTSSIAGSFISQRSSTSIISRKSYRSNKNRRKQERKLLSLKEGSAFEDLGLIRSLHEIITNTYKQQDEVNLLQEMLLYFNDDEYGEKLHVNSNKFIEVIEESKSEIWKSSAPTSIFELDLVHLYTSLQSQTPLSVQRLIEPHILYPPEKKVPMQHLDIFETLFNN